MSSANKSSMLTSFRNDHGKSHSKKTNNSFMGHIQDMEDQFERDGLEADNRMADLVPSPSTKRRRTLSAKARAALEDEDPLTDESVEPPRIKRSVPHSSRGNPDPSAGPKSTGFKPPDAHPASLVRLRSPVPNGPCAPPPKPNRKYSSYSEAVSGASGSSDEDAMSIQGEAGPGVDQADDDDEGSMAGFIDDRAEDELSVYSADSFEDPPLRKSRTSKKRSAPHPRSADSETDANRAQKKRRPRPQPTSRNAGLEGAQLTANKGEARREERHQHEGSGSKASEPIVISDSNDDDLCYTTTKAPSKKAVKEEEDEGVVQQGLRIRLKPRSGGMNTQPDIHRIRPKAGSKRDGACRPTTGSVAHSSKSRMPRSQPRDDRGHDDADDGSDSIEWPLTPEQPFRGKDKDENFHEASKKGKEARVSTKPNLLPGQDPLLVSTYAELVPLKNVELIPLFGSQDPPEEEALKLSQLLQSHKDARGLQDLQDRLVSMVMFKQQGVLVNGARASLDKVTTSAYGTSMYFVMPSSVVQPRNGARPFYACFLMTGVCAYSRLFRPASKSFNSRTVVDHRIGLYPIEYEYQRALSYIGNAAKKYSLRYSFTSGVLAFTTKTEASSDANSSDFGASPKKSLYHRDRTVPASQLSASNPVLENLRTSRFPAALGFQDMVPVFDARGSKFITGSFDLALLRSLPLITSEVEESSIVTVGFTSNTYVSASGSLAGTDVLSMNIQFVVVHAGPPVAK